MCADVFSSKKIRRDTKIVYAITVTFDCWGSYKSSAYHWLNAGLSPCGVGKTVKRKEGWRIFQVVPLLYCLGDFHRSEMPQMCNTQKSSTENFKREWETFLATVSSSPEHLSKLFKQCIQLSVWGHGVSSSTGDKSESPRLRASLVYL